MITQSQVDEVRRLLAMGKYSQRTIAMMTEVGRGTVNAIARGTRPDCTPVKKVKEQGPFEGPIQRCPDCGGRVHMPCRLCQARRLAEVSMGNPDVPSHVEPHKKIFLGLELEGPSRDRYEAIHEQRLLQGEPLEDPPLCNFSDPEDEEDEDFFPEMYHMSLLSNPFAPES